jgi:hypothetical protein
MINYNIEEQQRLYQQYIRQMQESMRRAQERSVMESIYSPNNSIQSDGGFGSAFGGGGDPNATGENNYVVDDYIDDYFE